ncbi:4-oxalocrotonate tautomerase [Escherichia coli]|nr:4-oxalocrotonate tautomerase [Escherichia coli]
MPHIDIKCFPRELDEQQKAALAADITDVIIRHLNSKDSSISIALQQIQPESWQAIWDAEIAPQMESLFRILCKYLFSEVAVQAVTELDNKAAHCHTPVPQWHRPFL